MKHPEKPQLRMVWPTDTPTEVVTPTASPGYVIRTYEPGDEAPFLSLMATAGFDPWDEEKLRHNVSRIIPGGWFFAVERESDRVVGTAMCLHNYSGSTPFTGDVGWLACDPSHRGRGLGYSLMAHVTTRFLRAGYSHIQLHTEYYRLPALAIYLRLGYLPVLYSQEMHSLWAEVCEQIGWEFTPDKWPRTAEAPQKDALDGHSAAASRRQVIQRAADRKRVAQSVLADLDLVRKWERFGRPVLVGAFAYDLLVAADIDMEVYCPDLKIEHGFQVLSECALNHRVTRTRFSNRLAERDKAFYWQLCYRDDDGTEWNIDMWSATKDYDLPRSEHLVQPMRASLTSETRRIILELKELRVHDSRLQCPSVDLYRAVLADDVRTARDLRAWLRTHEMMKGHGHAVAEGSLTDWKPGGKNDQQQISST